MRGPQRTRKEDANNDAYAMYARPPSERKAFLEQLKAAVPRIDSFEKLAGEIAAATRLLMDAVKTGQTPGAASSSGEARKSSSNRPPEPATAGSIIQQRDCPAVSTARWM